MKVMDKNASNVIKSVAIILMITHHFWGFGDNWIRSGTMLTIENTIGFSFESLVGAFAKICVGLFAFVTGYGFYLKKEKFKKFSYRIKKACKFLVSYWVVYFFELLVCYFFKEPLPTLKVMIQNLFGFSSKVFEYGTGYFSVCFAWYVYFYLMLLMLFPVICFNRMKRMIFNIGIPILIIFVVNILILKRMSVIPIISPLFNDFVEYVPVVIVAYNLAQYNIIARMIEYVNKMSLMVNILIETVLIFICFILKLKINKIFGLNIDFICVPILVVFFEIFRVLCNKHKCFMNTKLYWCINVLSKESTNIWYLHAIFFTPLRKFQQIALIPKISLLVIPWVLLILMPVAKSITVIQHLLIKKLRL